MAHSYTADAIERAIRTACAPSNTATCLTSAWRFMAEKGAPVAPKVTCEALANEVPTTWPAASDSVRLCDANGTHRRAAFAGDLR